jgi:hypothetical protein
MAQTGFDRRQRIVSAGPLFQRGQELFRFGDRLRQKNLPRLVDTGRLRHSLRSPG